MIKLRVSAALIAAALTVIGRAAEAQRTTSTTTSTRAELTALPTGITESLVASHVIAPASLRQVRLEDNSRETFYRLSSTTKSFTATPHLDVGALGKSLNTVLSSRVTGYVLQVRQNGNVIHNGIWEWAQTTADGSRGWTLDTRMHVASVSKWLTAVAMVKVLDANGISYDTPIAGYLPGYWTKGPNVDAITFRHLFTHRSGFSTGGSDSDFTFMKGRIAAGVGMVGGYDYENMNFGLMRILIPIIEGDVSKRAKFLEDVEDNDKAWDLVTQWHFARYMQARVFNPAGVSNVQFKPVSGIPHALAYRASDTGDGWNSGDVSAWSGGAAFHLSINELLNVMDHVRRRNTIIPAAKAQFMLDNYFGIDQAVSTPVGKIYNKNGMWRTSCLTETNCKTEQSVAYFLPNGMELALFVNSPITAEGFSLREIVKDVFLTSLEQ